MTTDPMSLRLWSVAQRGLAAGALVVLAPLIAVLALLVKLDSRGPAFYAQTRPGFGGRPFRTWKLRSMVTGADRNPALARATAADAPEITRVGRVLRELKLDELPQLLNVVRGDMALVGPRPIAPSLQAHLEAHIPGFARRLDVRPGLTSLGQVCILENEDEARLLEDWRLRFEGERHYLRHRGVGYDLVIVGLTVAYLLRKALGRLRPAAAARAVTPLLLLALLAGCATSLPPGPFPVRTDDVAIRPVPFTGDAVLDAAAHAAALEVREVRADALPAAGNDAAYRIGDGDRLRINVFNEPGLEAIVVAVDGHGEIQLPILERVAVDGMTLAELQGLLKTRYDAHFVEPWVVVQLVEARSRPVYLLGEFNAAGVHYLDRPTRLLQVLAAGRGLSENAWTRGARLIRDDAVAAVDVHGLLRGGDVEQNVWMQGGDVLYVPSLSDQRVFVLGAVDRPGAMGLTNHSTTLAEVLARAGGPRRSEADLSRVRVIRSLSPVAGQLVVVDFARILRGRAPDFPLQPGDVVFVPTNAIGAWNDVIAAVTPSLSAFSRSLDPFVTMKALED